MRVIKAFLVGATGLFIIITLFSLLIPSRVMVSRGVVVNNASAGGAYRQVASFENWKNWHPIFTVDSAKIYRHLPAIAGKDSGYIIKHRGRDVKVKLISADTNPVHPVDAIRDVIHFLVARLKNLAANSFPQGEDQGKLKGRINSREHPIVRFAKQSDKCNRRRKPKNAIDQFCPA